MILREKRPLPCQKFGKINNFYISCKAAASFDVGNDVASHATTINLWSIKASR
jgi:hypothetical protein